MEGASKSQCIGMGRDPAKLVFSLSNQENLAGARACMALNVELSKVNMTNLEFVCRRNQ